MNRPTLLDYALLANRLMLGLYVAFAGWRKIHGGVGEFVATGFANRQPGWLPDFIAVPYGHAFPWLELILGVLLVVGLFGRLTAAAMTALLLTIVIALAGAGEVVSAAPNLHHAPVVTAIAFLLAVTGPGALSLDALWRPAAVTAPAVRRSSAF